MSKALDANALAPRWRTPLLLAFFAIAVRVPFMSQKGFPEDQAQFAAWAEISQPGSEIAPPGGLDVLYAVRPGSSGRRLSNYPPGYLLVLRGMGSVFDFFAPKGEKLSPQTFNGIKYGRYEPAVDRAVWIFKIPAVLADAGVAALLCLWVTRRLGAKSGVAAGSLYALAPPIVFDSAVWGQVESVFMLPMVIALESARKGRLSAAAFWAAVAMLVKAQAVIFAPLILVAVILQAEGDVRRWGSVITSALLPIVAACVLFGDVEGMKEAYLGAASYYPFTHLNGFSMWFLLGPLLSPSLETMTSSYVRDSIAMLGPVSARHIGAAAVLLSWVMIGVRLWHRKCDDASLHWAARLLPLCFFALSTQMHERYLVPAIVAWLWAFANERRWWCGFMTISAATMVNLLWTWPGFGDNEWTRWCNWTFRTDWLGLAPGQWCATAIVVVAAMTALESAKSAATNSEIKEV